MSKPYRPPHIASLALFMAGRTHRLGITPAEEPAPEATHGRAALGRAGTRGWLRARAGGPRRVLERTR
jgi:hypothetical protein